jgi:hypothetical protein
MGKTRMTRMRTMAAVWPWQKSPPKAVLQELGQARSARPWILNLVQLAHWCTVAGTVQVAWLLFERRDALSLLLGPDWRVFSLLLSGLVLEAGGLAPMLMHAREDWQVAPSLAGAAPQEANDPLLRQQAYRFLFSGLTLGQVLRALAVFGSGPAALALLLPPALVAVLGPSRPLLPWQRRGVPLLPLAVPLAVAFLLSSLAMLAAMLHLFGPALAAAGLPAALALAPGVCQGLGGGIEASLAETRFNQWWHLLAVLVLNAGLVGEILLVRLLG